MILDLKRVFTNDGATIDLDKTFDFSEVEIAGTCPVPAPVLLKGIIGNQAGVVSVDAVLKYTYCAPCDRCAVPCNAEINEEIKHVLVTEISEEENEDMLLVEDMQLDLLELVRTDFYLSLPTKHICKPDCKGLCTVCGKNLNDGSCECVRKKVDPRLEKLKSLLDE